MHRKRKEGGDQGYDVLAMFMPFTSGCLSKQSSNSCPLPSVVLNLAEVFIVLRKRIGAVPDIPFTPSLFQAGSL